MGSVEGGEEVLMSGSGGEFGEGVVFVPLP